MHSEEGSRDTPGFRLWEMETQVSHHQELTLTKLRKGYKLRLQRFFGQTQAVEDHIFDLEGCQVADARNTKLKT